MGTALLDNQMIFLATTPAKSIPGSDLAKLAQLGTDRHNLSAFMIRGFIQSLLDDFWELEEIARTDFLTSLLSLVNQGVISPKRLDLSSLEGNLDLLESWDLDLVLGTLVQARTMAA